MKVCILSMQQIDNIGSLLQSYALKTTIAKLGNEVEFIDIKEMRTIDSWEITNKNITKNVRKMVF